MQRINEDIRTGQFKQVYLLYGEEAYLRRQYRDRLKAALAEEGDTMNTHCFAGKGLQIGEIIDLAETMPFLAQRRVIVIENSGFFKSGGEELAQYLTQPAETVYFIFAEEEIDRRSRLFKTIQSAGRAVEFGQQDENTLKRWIAGILRRENKRITEHTAAYLLDKTGTDMENIRRELEKLICYCLDREVVTEEDVDAVCTVQISNRIFDMISAIGDRRQQEALRLYYDLLALKEPPMKILALISRQCGMLLQVKELKKKGFDNKAIGTKVGLPAFVAGKYVRQAAAFSTAQLKLSVKKCVESEEAVKTGRMNDMMSVEILILTVLQEKNGI
ncbi:MAG: DNA polymerase III subunit delta [Lachnospiraceae bacterium]|nr:DNA polymerase III subunit delta [Lachnospiraceae bacterium]